MTSTIGIPIKLLNEAQVGHHNEDASVVSPLEPRLLTRGLPRQGHIITLEITSGHTYRGKLLDGKFSLADADPLLPSARTP